MGKTLRPKPDILISRSALPPTWIQSNQVHAGNSAARMTKRDVSEARQAAYECLAIADRIEDELAEAEAAEDTKKLQEEAQALSAAAGGRVLLNAAQPWEVEYWMNLARAARKLHGK